MDVAQRPAMPLETVAFTADDARGGATADDVFVSLGTPEETISTTKLGKTDSEISKSKLKQNQIVDVTPVKGSTVKRIFNIARFEFGILVIGCIASCGEGIMPVAFYWVRIMTNHKSALSLSF
jgi:hypothetical protein